MKATKRALTLLLVLVLALLPALSVSARAADLVAHVSTQKLEIDGQNAATVSYTIEGYNFFKLRDLACLLNGTAAQFSVGYDAETRRITVVSGEPYKVVGGELESLGTENQTARPSTQTLCIDGAEVTGLTVYSIRGYNYFKLRDLGEALGFGVDYDSARRTMLVRTAAQETPAPEESPAPDASWDPDISFVTEDLNGGTWDDSVFSEHKLTVINFWAYWCGPCVGELPDLQRLSENYADKGVQFFGICEAEDAARDLQTAKELGITYPNLIMTSDFYDYLYTGYVPTTIFVDGDGKVLGEAHIGSRNYYAWSVLIDGYLK